MAAQNPYFLIFFLSISTLVITSTSLSTVSISHTPNYTLICALMPSNNQASSYLNCTTFPQTTPNPINPSSDISFSAIAGGQGFFCGMRSPFLSSNRSEIRCWRFSDNDTLLSNRRNGKRIYSGPLLDRLEAGPSHLCGLVNGTGRLQCWQWPGFTALNRQDLSTIAVSGEFICGLSRTGNMAWFGSDLYALDRVVGNFSVVAAGSQHACAISTDGRLQCWGLGDDHTPLEDFEALALGENRSCGIRSDRTAFCWGENNFGLPENLASTKFISIEAKGRIFCGIVNDNFSLICWGNEMFESNSLVFDDVMPGACRTSCGPCNSLPGSGRFCTTGMVCEKCAPSQADVSTASPPSGPRHISTRNRDNVVFLVVGMVGATIGLAIVFCFLLFRYCIGRSCRVHDSRRLDEETTIPDPLSPGPVPQPAVDVARVNPMLALDKRLRSLISMGPSGKVEVFSLEVLLQVTNNFSEDHKIGSGSFGSVYRAKLEDGREVAIKRADLTTSTSYVSAVVTRRHEKETAFLAELALLSRVNHKNLVRLLGFYEDKNEFMLVYDFMPNGTLHDHLHRLETSPIQSWTVRLKVALDAAKGIEYLHTYAVPPIIHRDIKSSNILLDAQWTAKVSDFGLSLMGPDDDVSHISLRAAGTVGYMDPEYYRLQQLTTKSDVYSFGVVLLELLSGYRAIHRQEETGVPRNVVDIVVPHIITDQIHRILDPRLPPPTPCEIEAVTYVCYLAADCVNMEGRDRPSMTEVANSLDRALTACLAPESFSRSSTMSSVSR